MFTPKQFARLNHFAHTQNMRNCSVYESCTTVSQIEKIGLNGAMLATVVSEDVVKGIFSTRSVITIGPRGGMSFCKTSRYVF